MTIIVSIFGSLGLLTVYPEGMPPSLYRSLIYNFNHIFFLFRGP